MGLGFGTAGRVPRMTTGMVAEGLAAAEFPPGSPGAETAVSPLLASAAEAGFCGESTTAPSSRTMTPAPKRTRYARDCSTTRLLRNYRAPKSGQCSYHDKRIGG